MKSVDLHEPLIDLWSHLVRGAWIEIPMGKIILNVDIVAPRERCVD